MPRTESKKQLGLRGEDLACAELERQGAAGRTGLTLVFCTVQCRSGLGFGHALEAITFAKMRTLRQLAALWMREHHVRASTIRLDAIGVVQVSGERPSLTRVGAVG